ncbi:unnamed protein product [Symbiodinium natans]|uniref:Uncharacterized protein n=1 Tax=Symbiodinium natans TaxID=878477 RepID=A0A812T6S8_9DINO|nr:unnamed protein product [Symbiodinium natans]
MGIGGRGKGGEIKAGPAEPAVAEDLISAVTEGVKKALLEEWRNFRTELLQVAARDVASRPCEFTSLEPSCTEVLEDEPRTPLRCLKAKDVDLTPEKLAAPTSLEERQRRRRKAKVHMYRMDVNDEEALPQAPPGTTCISSLNEASDAYSDAQSFTVDEVRAGSVECPRFPDIVEEYEGLWEQLGSGVEASGAQSLILDKVECSECLWNPFALVMPNLLEYLSVPEILRWRTTSRETRHPKALLAHVAEMGSLERSTATVSLHTALKSQEAFDADHAGQQKLFDCGRWCMALASATLTHLPASDTRRIVEDNLRSLFRQCRDPDDIAHSPALRTLLVYGECALPYVQQLIANTMLGFIEASLSTSPLNYDAVLDFMVHLQVVLRSMTKCQRQKWVSLTVRFLDALAALDLDLSSICSVVVYDLIWLWRVDEDPRRTYASVMPKLREFLQSPSFQEFARSSTPGVGLVYNSCIMSPIMPPTEWTTLPEVQKAQKEAIEVMPGSQEDMIWFTRAYWAARHPDARTAGSLPDEELPSPFEFPQPTMPTMTFSPSPAASGTLLPPDAAEGTTASRALSKGVSGRTGPIALSPFMPLACLAAHLCVEPEAMGRGGRGKGGEIKAASATGPRLMPLKGRAEGVADRFTTVTKIEALSEPKDWSDIGRYRKVGASFSGAEVRHAFALYDYCQIGTMPIDPNAKPCQVTILGARVLEVENNLAAERSDLQTRLEQSEAEIHQIRSELENAAAVARKAEAANVELVATLKEKQKELTAALAALQAKTAAEEEGYKEVLEKSNADAETMKQAKEQAEEEGRQMSQKYAAAALKVEDCKAELEKARATKKAIATKSWLNSEVCCCRRG